MVRRTGSWVHHHSQEVSLLHACAYRGRLRRITDVTTAPQQWRLESPWKEVMIYWEGDHGYRFDCAWGVEPAHLYVPPAAIWDASVPAWLRGRRSIVVDRLRQGSGHDVLDDDRDYDDWQTRIVSSSDER